jgi:hypothetical protein
MCAHAVLAYFIAAVSPNMDVANAALPAYVTSLLFFVGLLLRIQDQPNYWKWVSGLPGPAVPCMQAGVPGLLSHACTPVCLACCPVHANC